MVFFIRGTELEEPGTPLEPGRVVVDVIRADEVVKGFFEFGGSDAYVLLQLDEQEHRTAVKKGKTENVWNERFTFDVGDDDLVIICSIWDKDRFTKDDLLGAFPIPLSDFASQEPTAIKKKMVLGAKKPDDACTISLQVTYTSFERLRTVKVANLAEKTDEVALKDLFPEFKRLYIVEDASGRAAYIETPSDEAHEAALTKNGKTVDGNALVVTDNVLSVREVRAQDEERKEAEAAAELERLEKEMEAKLAAQEAERKKLEEELAAAEAANAEQAASLRAQQEALEKRLAEEKAAEDAARAKAAAAKAAAAERAAAKKARAEARRKKAAAKKPASRLVEATEKTKKHISKGFGRMAKFFDKK